MSWPMSQDYNEAIQYPMDCFTDPELQQAEAVTNRLGLPVPCSGNFADVYAMTSGTRKWAVKCFTRQIPGLKERYVEISKYLQQVSLPFMVDFRFLEQGIRVRGQWFPVLKMQWVEGLALNTFVRDNLDKPQILDGLCQIWLKLATRLREANLAHCDLQHGNVLLVAGTKAGTLGVRLVDYDGMCVPALELLKSIELGHPNFQHPQRIREQLYGMEVDRFSHLVIYTALRALIAGGKELWQKYDNGDNLLFRQVDFESPRESALFQELLQLKSPEVKKLVQAVATAAQHPMTRVPLLEQLVEMPKPQPAPPPAAGPRRTGMKEMPAASGASGGDGPFAAVEDQPAMIAPRKPTRYRGKGKRGLVLASLTVGALLAGGLATYLATRSTSKPQPVELAQGLGASKRPSPKEGRTPLSSRVATAQRPPTSRPAKVETRPETKVEPQVVPKTAPTPTPLPGPGNDPVDLRRRIANGGLAKVGADGMSFIPLVEGAQMPIAGQPITWKAIPDWLKDTSFGVVKDSYQGFLSFRVETDGLVVLATSSRWRGGGNRSGGWYEECKTKDDLLKDKWQEAGTLPSSMGDWVVFWRVCRKGENFRIRTEKYAAPTILWRTKDDRAATKSSNPESQEWYGAVLGVYGQWGKSDPHPYVTLTVPNKNLWTEAIQAKLRGKIDFGEIQYTGSATLLIPHDGNYLITGSNAELSLDGKRVDAGEIELHKGAHKIQIYSNTHGRANLPNAAAAVMDKSTGNPVPFVVTGTELKEFLSRTVSGKQVTEVSGEKPLRIPYPRPAAPEWYGAVLGIYGQWGKSELHPYVTLTVPNRNLWTEAIQAKLRGKIDFTEIQYTGTATLRISHDGIYQITAGDAELSLDGKRVNPGEIELRKGAYKIQIYSNTHGRANLPNAAAAVMDKSTGNPVPFVVTGTELKEFLSRTVSGKQVTEVSGEKPLRIP